MRDHGGHAVALCDSMDAVYGIRPGEVFWAASDVGCSCIVYGLLLKHYDISSLRARPALRSARPTMRECAP